MPLTEGQRAILTAVSEHDGQWNWYQLGRATLPKLDSSADFVLQQIVKEGLISQREAAGEPLPRLYITAKGRIALGESR